ncbi:cardiotrophin-1 isoform 4 [Mus musculus]|uniref:cardiotrophin-1 isoform 4 n=1 Tax=Mus musculus TaxID=10090 RepID=UPI0011AEAB5B|nr:cardiotrophin-1 isoform 4 [Mus musculus]
MSQREGSLEDHQTDSSISFLPHLEAKIRQTHNLARLLTKYAEQLLEEYVSAATGRALWAAGLLTTAAAAGRPEWPGSEPCRATGVRAAAAGCSRPECAARAVGCRPPPPGGAEPARPAPAAEPGGRSPPGSGPGRRGGDSAGRAGRCSPRARARARHRRHPLHGQQHCRHLLSQGAGVPRVRPLWRVGEPHRGRPGPAGARGRRLRVNTFSCKLALSRLFGFKFSVSPSVSCVFLGCPYLSAFVWSLSSALLSAGSFFFPTVSRFVSLQS